MNVNSKHGTICGLVFYLITKKIVQDGDILHLGQKRKKTVTHDIHLVCTVVINEIIILAI